MLTERSHKSELNARTKDMFPKMIMKIRKNCIIKSQSYKDLQPPAQAQQLLYTQRRHTVECRAGDIRCNNQHTDTRPASGVG